MPRLLRKLYPTATVDRTDKTRASGNFDLFDDAHDDDKYMNNKTTEASDYIVDIREYDVPYHVRVMIDMGKSPQPSQNQLANTPQVLESVDGTL